MFICYQLLGFQHSEARNVTQFFAETLPECLSLMIFRSRTNMSHMGIKIRSGVQIKETHNTRSWILAWSFWNWIRMFVLMIIRSSLNVGHNDPNTRSNKRKTVLTLLRPQFSSNGIQVSNIATSLPSCFTLWMLFVERRNSFFHMFEYSFFAWWILVTGNLLR